MKKGVTLGLGILIAIGAFFTYQNKVFGAACVLNGGNWGKQAVAIGEDVVFALNGSGCDGLAVSLNIWEEDPGLDDFIRTVPSRFVTATNAPTTIRFTQADYIQGGNESSDEQMYIVADVFNGNGAKISTTESSRITLQKPASGSCQLSSAKWSWTFRDQPILGSPVQLTVTGVGCPGFQVQLDIYEQDIGLGDDHMPNPLHATFNAAGTQATTNWNVDGSWDDDDIGSYDFYFKAAAGGASLQSDILNDGSGIPLRSGKGCLNCNAVLAPNPVQCSDGTSQPRGTFANAEDACNGHIGDSLGSPGSTPTPAPGGTVVPGTATRSYSFNITNPLAGGPNDLFDIINIVTQWIMYISVPLAVLWIMYAGFLMLTAGPKPENFQKGRDILKYTVLGLAIIFIGKGFVSLIISIIKLGGTSP